MFTDMQLLRKMLKCKAPETRFQVFSRKILHNAEGYDTRS